MHLQNVKQHILQAVVCRHAGTSCSRERGLMLMWFLKTSHLRSLGELTVNNLFYCFKRCLPFQARNTVAEVCMYQVSNGGGGFIVFLILHEGVILPHGGNAHF